jgi:flagellar biosynthesis/type III secretory pathway protein FliH
MKKTCGILLISLFATINVSKAYMPSEECEKICEHSSRDTYEECLDLCKNYAEEEREEGHEEGYEEGYDEGLKLGRLNECNRR